jgi:hypothetical protein
MFNGMEEVVIVVIDFAKSIELIVALLMRT